MASLTLQPGREEESESISTVSPRSVSIPRALADIYWRFESSLRGEVATHECNIDALYGIYDTRVMSAGERGARFRKNIAPHTDYMQCSNFRIRISRPKPGKDDAERELPTPQRPP
ncbi:MAG: hypothetical protein AMXMBFR74_01650 [Parvibaculum sp.]